MNHPATVPDAIAACTRPGNDRRSPPPRRLPLIAAALLALVLGPGARAQTENPVYLDDSTRTRDALVAIDGLMAGGNQAEAVRTLQDLFDTEGHRVIESPTDPDLFVGVRQRLIDVLLSNSELLAAYREAQEAPARRLIDQGNPEEAERTRWPTKAGFEAALRLAQRDVENGRFESARLLLSTGENHPDAGDPQLAQAAADLARLVASYIPRDQTNGLAFRWAVRAGQRYESPAPRPWPPSALARSANPTQPAPPIDLTQIDRRSSQAVRLAPESARPEPPPQQAGRTPPPLEVPWVMPAVVGDLVLVNDGEYLSAWDRFTLAMKWRLRPPTPGAAADSRLYSSAMNYRTMSGQGLEDASFITAAGPLALATTGLARAGVREGDSRLHAVELESGRLVWSAAIDTLDPALASGSIRGPAMVDADTIVLTVRTFIQFRRLQSVAMVGLDLHDGSKRWVRELASTGMLPYRRATPVSDLGVIDGGVVYRVDEIGVMSAIEAATGRVVWIRRVVQVGSPGDAIEAWAMAGPIVTDEHVIALSPDHRDLVRLDRRTGQVLGRRSADVLGWPRYVLRVGDQIACVGGRSIAFVPLAEFESGKVLSTPPLPPPLVGRVVVSGDKVLAPVGTGVAVIDPLNPGMPLTDASVVPLPRRGMILPASSQLLLADNDRLRSFLVWPEAIERLRDQVEASPNDPLPPLTLARLSARAGEWSLLVPSVERCLDVLDAAPGEHAGVRQDLFSFALQTVRQSRGGGADPDSPVAPPEVARALLESLGRAAREPEQHLAHLMERGTSQELSADAGGACQTYQEVLSQPVLASAMWNQGVTSTRGSIEATRRLQRLVAAHGAGVYGAFEASAGQELAALGQGETIEALAGLAERYPVASITPGLWLRVARGHEGRGRSVEAISALMSAQTSGAALARAGVVADGASFPEAVGRLVTALDRLGEPAWALSTLERTMAQFPAMAPTVDGQAVDVAALRADLAGRSEPLPGLPAIGAAFDGLPQSIPARQPLAALLPAPGEVGHQSVLLAAHGSARVELWNAAAGGLVMAWEKDSVRATPPSLLTMDAQRVVLFVPGSGRDGASIECLSRADGHLLWRTEAFESLFPPDPDLQARFIAAQSQGATIQTPLDGAVRLDDMLATHDGQSLVLLERSGRTASFDMATGEVLWARRLDLSQVHDAAVLGPRLVVGGAFPHPVGPDSVQTTMGPALVLVDSRTGDVLCRHDDASAPDDARALGEVRWVKITPGGVVLSGLRLGVGAMSLESGLDLWRSQGPATASTLDAWIDRERLWVLGADRGLRQIDIGSGELRAGALPTQGRTGSRRPVRLTRLEGRVLLTSGRGVVLLDSDGALLGVDAIDRQDTLLPPAVGSPLVALLEAEPRRGSRAYRLSLVNTISAKEEMAVDLLLDGVPRGVMLLDGFVLITTDGGVTAVAALGPG